MVLETNGSWKPWVFTVKKGWLNPSSNTGIWRVKGEVWKITRLGWGALLLHLTGRDILDIKLRNALFDCGYVAMVPQKFEDYIIIYICIHIILIDLNSIPYLPIFIAGRTCQKLTSNTMEAHLPGCDRRWGLSSLFETAWAVWDFHLPLGRKWGFPEMGVPQ